MTTITRNVQRERYARRRATRCYRRCARRVLLSTIRMPAFICGLPVASHAGTASRGWLPRGILVAPGDFYGAGGAQHVRVALTATDERIAAAVHRLSAPTPL